MTLSASSSQTSKVYQKSDVIVSVIHSYLVDLGVGEAWRVRRKRQKRWYYCSAAVGQRQSALHRNEAKETPCTLQRLWTARPKYASLHRETLECVNQHLHKQISILQTSPQESCSCLKPKLLPFKPMAQFILTWEEARAEPLQKHSQGCLGFVSVFKSDLYMGLSISLKIIQQLEWISRKLFLQSFLKTRSVKLSQVVISCGLHSNLHCWCAADGHRFCLHIQKTDNPSHLGCTHISIPDGRLLPFNHKKYQICYSCKEFDRTLVWQTEDQEDKTYLLVTVSSGVFCLPIPTCFFISFLSIFFTSSFNQHGFIGI